MKTLKTIAAIAACGFAFSANATAKNEFDAPVKYNYVELGYVTTSSESKISNDVEQDSNTPYLAVSMLPFEFVGFNVGLGYSQFEATYNGVWTKKTYDSEALTYSAEVMPRLPITESIDAFIGIGAAFTSVSGDGWSDSDSAVTYRGGVNAALADNIELTLQAASSNQDSNPSSYGASIQFYMTDNVAIGFSASKSSDDILDTSGFGFNLRFGRNKFDNR